MYREEPEEQQKIEDFYLPFGGHLDESNRWMILSKKVPWDKIEEDYAKQFSSSGNGAPAKSIRMALGSLIIKEKFQLSDDEIVEHIRETPYLRYFIGMKSYKDESPFDASMMVHFRKRLDGKILQKANEVLFCEYQEKDLKKNGRHEIEEDEGIKNKGKLIADATCCPSDIRYPNDMSLLNEARENTERIIDFLFPLDKESKKDKPRDYRQIAHADFIAYTKKRRPGHKVRRKSLRKQLNYLRHNIKYIERMFNRIDKEVPYRLISRFKVIKDLYRQQRQMYERNDRKVEKRMSEGQQVASAINLPLFFNFFHFSASSGFCGFFLVLFPGILEIKSWSILTSMDTAAC